METQTVRIVESGSDRSEHVFHTKVCKAIERMGISRTIEVDSQRLSERWRQCRYCSGEFVEGDCGERGRKCPICGEIVSVTAAHIRNVHDSGGDV